MKQILKQFILPIATLPFLVSTGCGQKVAIDQSNVERIISTLASDEMLGRATFTEGNDLAGEFINQEFEKIGLEKLNESEDYFQSFSLYNIKPQDIDIILDGQSIDESQYIVSAGNESFEWTQESAVQITTIRETDNFRSSFGPLLRGQDDALVIVSTNHTEALNRVRGFLSRGSRTMELGSSPDIVFILSDDQPEEFSISVSSLVEQMPLRNVIGKITGKRKDEIVLFTGHYDHIGIRPPVNGDSIANGANDNASGTTAVISLAEYFKKLGTPERTLLFVAFTAEEMGGFGSRYFSMQLDPTSIVAMFNIEMIGKPATDGPNTAWITGFDKSDFGEILQKAVEGTQYSFYADPYPTQNLFYRSDNATLARLGVPAHSISTTPIDVDKDYHQVTDHVETLDLAHLTNTIKAIATSATSIISGKQTPTRVDPANVNR